jgi:DNA-binding transcriptional ArsR family regulator
MHPFIRDAVARANGIEAIWMANGLTSLDNLADLFSVLGDPTRLRILSEVKDGESTVQALSELLGISCSAVSHQLRLMKAHHLVRYRREGKNIFYSLADQCVWDLLDAGGTHLLHLAPRGEENP